LGADVLSVPAFAIIPIASPAFEQALHAAAAHPSDVLLVFTSVNAVHRFVECCGDSSIAVTDFAGARIATVGPATQRAADDAGLTSDVVAAVHSATGLVSAIGRSDLPLEHMTLLYPRARDARGEIESELSPLVATTEAHVVYGTEAETMAPPFQSSPDVVTFASSSACLHFEHVVVAGDAALVKESIPVVCIGPATAATAAGCGYMNVITAQVHSAAGLIDAVVSLLKRKG